MNVLGLGRFDDREALSDCLDAGRIFEERLKVLAICRDDKRLMFIAGQIGQMTALIARHAASRLRPFEHPYLS